MTATSTRNPKTRAMFVPSDEGDKLVALGSTVTVKATSDDTGGAFEWVLIDAVPGDDVIPHRHPWGEAYYMLDGALDVQVGARRHVASIGDFLMIPPRALHSFQVLRNPTRFLHVSIGPGATAMFRDLNQLATTLDPGDPATFVAVLDVAARHDVEVVLPEHP